MTLRAHTPEPTKPRPRGTIPRRPATPPPVTKEHVVRELVQDVYRLRKALEEIARCAIAALQDTK